MKKKDMTQFDRYTIQKYERPLSINKGLDNINLCSNTCKDYLLNKNYPLIKLKKLNNLNKDEKYILDLIQVMLDQ